MNYRDQLRPASFRDVPFQVAAADTSVGRRVAIHEFPLSEAAQAEDLGRKASEFQVDGFLVGNDYIDQMRRLAAALAQAGPGTLVHPSHGTRQVVLAQPGRLRESFIEKRGMVSFSLAFVEVGDPARFDVAAPDTQQVVEDKADAAYAPCTDDFARTFSVAGAPDWSVASLTGEIDRVSATLADIRAGMKLDLSALSAITRSAALFKLQLVTLLNTPAALAGSLVDQVRSLTDLFDFNPPKGLSAFSAARHTAGPLNAMLTLAGYGKPGTATARPDVPLNGSGVRAQQAANQAALFALVRRAALIEAARAVVFQPFNSYNDAAAVRDALYDALEAEMLTAPDSVYAALAALRVAVVDDVAARGLDLTRLSTVTLMDAVPALVLSHRLYGTTAYADELVERNDVLNPLVMPGGVPLEVRSV